MSLLLKSSNSRKGYIVQSKSLKASNISYDDLSYVRNNLNNMRSSMECSSASLSSSIYLGCSQQTETHIHQQSSGHKSDMENNCINETPTKHKRSISSLSGASVHELKAANADKEIEEVPYIDPHELPLASEYVESETTCADLETNGIVRTGAEHTLCPQLGDDLVESIMNCEGPALQDNCENLINNSSNTWKDDRFSAHVQNSTQEQDDDVRSSCAERVCDAENPQVSSVHAISETEIGNADMETQSVDFVDSETRNNDSQPPSVADNNIMTPTAKDARSDAVDEESTVVFEDMNEKKSKSLTTEELMQFSSAAP